MKELQDILHSTSNLSASKAAVISVFYVNNVIKESILNDLKPFDLSIEQFNVLRILRGQKGKPLNLQDIQERMINKMSNTTRLVDKLIKKNFVKRNICEQNRRKVEIVITESGLDILKELDDKIINTEKNITSQLTSEELKQLNTLLLKINN
ncbi:MarR family winged helix-turn-helix transcriptional regulator [Winogradskyella jejuensis]|nr:MarR family transcriptional regulator [Winogradskyella jejuensis]